MRLQKCYAIVGLCVSLSACSGEAPEENVFKAQTDAIAKAENANKLVEEAAQAQRQAIDAQSQ